MSQAPAEDPGTAGEPTPAEAFTAITSQEDLNKVLNDRLTRERAKFADYRDLKSKADKLDQIEAANQTEAEKSAKRIADLEAEMSSVRRDSLRLKIAGEHGITDADDIDLFLTGTDEQTLTKQAKRLAERVSDNRRQSANRVPREGTTPSPSDASSDERETTRALFGSG